MVFGEINEPSTRAMIEDDFQEYPDYSSPTLQWQGNFTTPPEIESLIFIETEKITKLFRTLVASACSIQCSLQEQGLEIYKTSSNRCKFIVIYNRQKNLLLTGEVIEAVGEWIKRAKQVYAITSEPASAYQQPNLLQRPEILIRHLSQGELTDGKYKKLEAPNLISGLGADVVSYCIHSNLKCSLFVVYMDNSPLDSINIKPIWKLMNRLGLPCNDRFSNISLNESSSNLYL